MIEKTELEKVDLANDLLVVLKSVSTQDQIDILQLALDSMLAKKRLNDPPVGLAQMENEEPVTDIWYVKSQSECKHIRKVKMKIAGEKQKNKLQGVE
jgi:hypothetical protein